MIDPSPSTRDLAWAAVLCALAVGLAVPPALALWIARRALRHAAESHEPEPVYATSDARKMALNWTVLGGLALIAGVLLAAAPALAAAAERLYDDLIGRFLWGPVSLSVVESLLVFGLGMVLFPPIGWAVGYAHGLADPSVRWTARSPGWTLIGAGLAALASIAAVAWRVTPALVFIVAAVPLFAVAILSVRRSHHFDQHASWSETPDVPSPPVARDRWPAVLRACVILVALSAVTAGIWWTRAFTVLGRFSDAESVGLSAALILAFGAGLLGGRTSDPAPVESIGGFATGCIVAGVVTALALTVTTLIPAAVAFESRPALTWILAFGCGGGSMFAAGRATACGHNAVLQRVGSRAAAGASLVSLSLFSMGVVVLFMEGAAVARLGTYACLVAAAVTLLAVGGVLVIHEPAYVAHVRRLRLTAVFLIVVLMALAMPWPSRTWLQTAPGLRVRLIETEWLTFSQWVDEERLDTRVEPPPTRPVDANVLDPVDGRRPLLQVEAIPPSARAAFVGHWSESLRSAVGRIDTACARYPFDEAVRGPWDRPAQTDLSAVPMNATYMLRLHGGQLGLVILSLDGTPRIARERLLDTGILDRARSALTPDGLAVLLLPLDTIEPSELEHWLDATWRMTAGDFRWTCVRSCHAAVLVIAFGHEGGAWPDRWAEWSSCRLRASTLLPATGVAG